MIAPRKRKAPPAAERLSRAYSYWWLYRTTAHGRVVLLGLILAGSLGSASIDMPLFRLFTLLFFLLGIAALAGLLFRPRLMATAHLPQQVVAGQTVQVEVCLQNVSRRTAHQIGAAFFEATPELRHVPTPILNALPPGVSGKVSAALETRRRGAYVVALRVFSVWPFQLFRFPGAPVLRQPLLVAPAFHPLAGLDLPVAVRHQPGGIALSSDVGESPEYIGNREYRAGDSLRHIDFKAWARLSKPAVREFQEEYYTRIALVLDTQVAAAGSMGRLARGLGTRAPQGDPRFEAAVSLCAAVADVFARGEYILDLFAAGPELYIFRAGRHTAHLENVLEILACVEASQGNPFETLNPAIAGELGNIAAVICVFLDWDTRRERLLQEARDHGCAVKAVLVREPGDDAPVQSAVCDVTVLSTHAIQHGAVEVL